MKRLLAFREGIRFTERMRIGWFLSLFLFAVRSLHAETPGDDTFGVVRGLIAPESPPPPFVDGKIEPRPGDTIVFLGGTEVMQEQFNGSFEALLTKHWADKKPKFRNLAWQADTVYRQQRPQYFYDAENHDKQPGSTPDQRKRTTADIIFVRFGKMESLDGAEAIPAFKEAYGKLLDRLTALTPRVVIVEPTPFFDVGPARSFAKVRNETLRQYNQASRDLATARKLPFLQLTNLGSVGLAESRDGIHPTEVGQVLAAVYLFAQITDPAPVPRPRGLLERDGGASGGVGGRVFVEQDVQLFAQITDSAPEPAEQKLRASIVEKNRVWLQYYRPTNWAFLYGDRQHVPSSRDHQDTEKRWFPFEIETALPIIKDLEKSIHEQAAQRP